MYVVLCADESVVYFQQKEKAYFESGKSKKKPTAWWKDPSLPFPVEMKK